MKTRLIVASLVALLILSACGTGNHKSKATSGPSATPTTQRKPSATRTTSSAATPTQQKATPAGTQAKGQSCLSDFPVYPGAKKLADEVTERARPGVPNTYPAAAYVTGDDVGKVIKFYKTHAPKGNWEKGTTIGAIIWNRGSQSMQILVFKDDKGELSRETKGKTIVLVICGVSLNASKFPAYTKHNGLPSDTVRAVSIDPNGAVWVATFGGLAKFDGKKWQVYTTKDGLPSNHTSAIAFAPDGSVWAGTEFRGIAHFDGKSWKVYRKSDGLVSDTISSISISPDGTVWVGSCQVKGGVSRFDGKKWTGFDKTVLPGAGCVKAILATRDGTVWAGTLRGLFRFDGQKWVDSKLVHGQVLSLAEDPSGGLWIGTFHGAIHFDGKSTKEYSGKEGPVGNAVRSIAVAPDGSVWFATFHGASRLIDGKWKHFTEKTGLPTRQISSIAVTSDGKALLGTSSEGVIILNSSDY